MNKKVYIQNLKKVIINKSFVFYFQPLNHLYHCFIVFIQPIATRKASNAQIELLNNLKNILNEEKFDVISFF